MKAEPGIVRRGRRLHLADHRRCGWQAARRYRRGRRRPPAAHRGPCSRCRSAPWSPPGRRLQIRPTRRTPWHQKRPDGSWFSPRPCPRAALVRSAARAWQRPCFRSRTPQRSPKRASACVPDHRACSNARFEDLATKPFAHCAIAIQSLRDQSVERLQRIKTRRGTTCFFIDIRHLNGNAEFLTRFQAISMVRAASRAGGLARFFKSFRGCRKHV